MHDPVIFFDKTGLYAHFIRYDIQQGWKILSVAHLSAQFKKVTGQTPSQFKAARSTANSRLTLDSI